METARRRCFDHLRRSRVLNLRFASTLSPANATAAPAPPFIQKEAPTDQRPKEVHVAIRPENLHHYAASTPPTPLQQSHTRKYFAVEPLHVYTAARFVTLPRSPYPEVCFVGRSNVGKSSLLNALFGRPSQPIARTSSKPGRTKTMNGFGCGGLRQDSSEPLKALGSGALIVVDMPGYGKGSRSEWGPEIDKFFLKRKNLRKVFALVDALHGLKRSDIELLRYFKTQGIPFQVVVSKADRILCPGPKTPSREKVAKNLKVLEQVFQDIRQELGNMDREMGNTREIMQPVDILSCSAEKELLGVGLPRGRLGIDAVRWAVLTACGLDCDADGKRRLLEGVTILEDDD